MRADLQKSLGNDWQITLGATSGARIEELDQRLQEEWSHAANAGKDADILLVNLGSNNILWHASGNVRNVKKGILDMDEDINGRFRKVPRKMWVEVLP